MHEQDFNPADLDVRISELLVATADAADEAIDASVGEVLRLIRERLQMDVVFVSEFVDGQRILRRVEQSAGTRMVQEGQVTPLEETWCQRVIDGRMPAYIADARRHPATASLPGAEHVGTHLTTPIVLRDGSVYGTLCCFSLSPGVKAQERDLRHLQLTAQLTAQKIDQGRPRRAQTVAAPMPSSVPDWKLEPTSRFQEPR
jgi:GAF domain-containing protein